MNRFKSFLFIVIFFVTISTVYAQDAEVKEDISQIIIGKWKIAPTTRVASGDITFDKYGMYDLNEKFHDGSGSGTKGEYKINCNVSPAKMCLCLGNCDQPGSELTTRFGIIRILPDNKLEICTSPDGNYPSDFCDDKMSENTMILTRIE
ncbi:MAG: hypothetical protein KAS53_00145 [Candidatus Cloacimonetes bacterium]|nr:hypothetical protein [Candidatus Cloacimonadota bacterium]